MLWLQLLKVSGREGNLIAVFQDEHSRVLQQLQAFTFFPESQAAPKKTFERKSMERQSARRQPLVGLVSALCPVSGLAEPRTATHTCLVPLQPTYLLQSDDTRAALLARYPPESLFQADRNFNAAQDLDVSLLEGDIVGVIKKKDPMGSQNRWLIDNGGRWLFPALGACCESPPLVSLCPNLSSLPLPLCSDERLCVQLLSEALQPPPQPVGRLRGQPLFQRVGAQQLLSPKQRHPDLQPQWGSCHLHSETPAGLCLTSRCVPVPTAPTGGGLPLSAPAWLW